MEGLKAVGDTKMLAILDAVLVAYVKHHAEFVRANTLELFTKLYDQLPEFSELDKRFLEAYPTMNTMLVNYLREQVQEVLNLTV
jgi:hypothetical protein